MKDLGELLKINVDSNQRHVKDHTKPFESDGGRSPKEASESKSKKKEAKPKSKKFKKIEKALNVDKIPGSN